jgi:hypothetical protein
MQSAHVWAFLGWIAFTTPVWAQAAAQGGSAQPSDLTVAPGAPRQMPEATAPVSTSAAGTPANICQELLAFVQSQAQAAPAANVSTNANSAATIATQSQQTGAPGQTAPPVDRNQHASGQSAPVPTDNKVTTRVDISASQAEELLRANNLRGCQSAVRRLRLDGVALPPGLLALAALREDLVLKAAPAR